MTFALSYDGRRFCGVSNSETGEVSDQTVFHYFQDGDILRADYAGGDVLRGTMIGLVLPDGGLEFHYQHLNRAREVRIGRCVSRPEILPDGRIRLHESWQWLDGDRQTGTSVVEELPGS
ncbi:n-acetylglutamate synthase [Phaeovibrio sulfidiphilus]|uniref:N-acetylglutamate synthase n=1 Tax=Phaeovibrio sulfidiphilus TaxID=1220600 RepID=A0A8J6YXB9_9PROT|nr:n-acetylglutamate synthase [Phaeovibrio sulfidiphilus]MBE1236398.1 n-acetylglutamate synthase [Phaeovibrio sulfidiphilus]